MLTSRRLRAMHNPPCRASHVRNTPPPWAGKVTHTTIVNPGFRTLGFRRSRPCWSGRTQRTSRRCQTHQPAAIGTRRKSCLSDDPLSGPRASQRKGSGTGPAQATFGGQ